MQMPRSDTVAETRPLDIGFWFPRPDRGSRLAEELRKHGHGVTIYHSQDVPRDQRFVQRVPYGLWSGLKSLWKTDHEVYYTSSSFIPVFQLCLLRLFRRKPYVYTLNAPIWVYYSEMKGRLVGRLWARFIYPALLKLVISEAGSITTNSIFLSDLMKSKFPPYRGKIVPVHNGINFESHRDCVAKPDAWPEGRIRILSVSTLNFGRKSDGVILLLKAFEAISAALPEAVLLIAAKCSYTAELERVRKHVRTLACASRVRIEPNRADVPDLLATADLFIYATPADSSDSLPRALLEAQAAGVPTVTTGTVGCPEAVSDGVTGYVVAYDADSVAGAAIGLVRDNGKAAAMAAAGREIVQRKFAWDKMSDEYERLFAMGASNR